MGWGGWVGGWVGVRVGVGLGVGVGVVWIWFGGLGLTDVYTFVTPIPTHERTHLSHQKKEQTHILLFVIACLPRLPFDFVGGTPVT